MHSDIQNKIIRPLGLVLFPLAKALLRLGVTYSEFSDIAKVAFVNAASSEFGKRGRHTNVSRVAIQTGLSRKEISRIKSYEDKMLKGDINRSSPVSDLLHNWYTNPSYLDRNGNPISLPYDEGEASFTRLVKGVVGDIPPGAMRTELERLNLIAIAPEGLISVRSRVFVPVNLDERVINGLDPGLRQLAETFAYNSNPDVPGKTRFQAVIDSPIVSRKHAKKVSAELRERLEVYAGEVDDYLASYEADGEEDTTTIGVGIYYFEEEKSPKS